MTRSEIQDIIEQIMLDDYGVDIRGWPAETPISKVREQSSKLDSLEFLQFIFNVEDRTGIDLPEGGEPPTTIGQLLDNFVKASETQ